jgi:hypothetical protein
MPAHAVLLGFLAEQAAGMVVKGARNVLAKMPWARDTQRVQVVERKIAVLVDRVAMLARNVPTDAADPLLEPLIQDFRQDLLNEHLTENEAKLVVDSVRAQIRTTVLQPLQDAERIVSRVEVLEKENEEQAKRIAELETYRQRIELTELERERHARMLQTLCAVALALAAVATLLALVGILRR